MQDLGHWMTKIAITVSAKNHFTHHVAKPSLDEGFALSKHREKFALYSCI